ARLVSDWSSDVCSSDLYLLLADPDADLRGALADWIARRRIALQSKLVVGFLVLVAGILLVGWAGFAAMEDMHLRLHSVEIRAERSEERRVGKGGGCRGE